MNPYDLSHVSDEELLSGMQALAAHERALHVRLVTHMARVDEDELDTLVRAARLARQYRDIIPAMADGRLSPWTVVMLEHHLYQETAAELLAAAANKTEREIHRLFAERSFLPPDVEE